MFGGAYFGAAYLAGLIGAANPAAITASATITVTATATMARGPAYLAANAAITWTAEGNFKAPISTTIGIVVGGVPITGRVRYNSLTIRDILNDAPNTCAWTMEGDGPAVGQSVRIMMGQHLLFTGTVQTVDQSYESLPEHVAWNITAIDDTAKANARRPFGTFLDVSATTIAQSITASFAPGFSTAGIAAGLPPVTIIFDGSQPFIACLAQLATAVGGYCKIEDHTIFLFLTDPGEPPDPIDAFHPFLNTPPIQMNVDSSQLRTRVYGKGYGENIPSDITVGETLIPIQDGVMFPPLGGTAILSLTADGAQSERVTFTATQLATGGTLVGPGAAPTTMPTIALAAGAGVTTGHHNVALTYTTAVGTSLPSPPAAIEVGTHPPPDVAPTANTPQNGTGPDSGSHDYAVSFVTSYGETVAGPISNAIAVSAATGQIPAPYAPNPQSPLAGSGVPAGTFDYKVTLTNSTGETTPSGQSGSVVAGLGPPPVMAGWQGSLGVGPGGNMDIGNHFYWFTGVVAGGETLVMDAVLTVGIATTGYQTANVQTAYSTDPRVTAINIYRGFGNAIPAARFVKQIPNIGNNSGYYYDGASNASIAANPAPPTVDTSRIHQGQIPITNIPIGPGGTTGRKLYRRFQQTDPNNWYLIASFNNNTATTYTDTSAFSSTAPTAPTSNTTGTAIQKIPVTDIPIGPTGVAGRRLYRRFNGAGPFKLVTSITNNTGTTFTDTIANAALGVAALTTPTAIGNQIIVTLPIGPAAVTGREVYMSPTTGGPRHRVAAIADNTTISYTITTPDAGLTGPTPPTADTSGLAQPQGQVNPGATVLPVASAAAFFAGGGWVSLGGGQTVRYNGLNAQNLIGIPATGPGALTTTVLYGSQALPTPMLVGVVGVTRPILKGAAIHIWIQRDDLLAQAEQAARAGGDGVIEFLITDARRGVESLAARCDADLAMFARPIVTVSYATRDMNTKSGKTIPIALDSPRINATLIIQDVTITEIDIVPELPPRYTVKASSVRFSLEDTLRQLIATGAKGTP